MQASEIVKKYILSNIWMQKKNIGKNLNRRNRIQGSAVVLNDFLMLASAVCELSIWISENICT